MQRKRKRDTFVFEIKSLPTVIFQIIVDYICPTFASLLDTLGAAIAQELSKFEASTITRYGDSRMVAILYIENTHLHHLWEMIEALWHLSNLGTREIDLSLANNTSVNGKPLHCTPLISWRSSSNWEKIPKRVQSTMDMFQSKLPDILTQLKLTFRSAFHGVLFETDNYAEYTFWLHAARYFNISYIR